MANGGQESIFLTGHVHPNAAFDARLGANSHLNFSAGEIEKSLSEPSYIPGRGSMDYAQMLQNSRGSYRDHPLLILTTKSTTIYSTMHYGDSGHQPTHNQKYQFYKSK